MHLITGKKGEPHITAENHGFINAQILGNGNFIFDFGNNFNAVKLNDNSVEIKDGQGMFGGRHFEIEYGTTENVTIENGALGLNRKDLIVARYAKDSDGIETIELAVKKGTAAASNPEDPYYDTRTPYTGADGGEFPLWRVNISGTTITSLEPVYDIVDFDFAQLQLDIQAALGEFDDAMDTINGKSNKNNTPKVWAGSGDPFTVADDTDWPESSEIKVGDIYVKTATNEFYFVKLVASGGQGAAKLPQWERLLTAADIANKLDRNVGIKTFFGSSSPSNVRANYNGLMSGDIYFEGSVGGTLRNTGNIRKVYIAYINENNEDLVSWRELTTNLSNIWNSYYTKTETDNLLNGKQNSITLDGNILSWNGNHLQLYGSVIANDASLLSSLPYIATFRQRLLENYGNTNLQAKLTAGNNITIDANNVISATGGGGGTVDTSMSDSSTNAVQNRVIKSYVDTGLGTKQANTTITTNTTDTDITLTLADNNEYRYTQELDSIDLTMPNGNFIASIVFASGSTATLMTYDSGIKWSGDDVVMGFFVPTADKTYNIVLWYDGININGVVRGVA